MKNNRLYSELDGTDRQILSRLQDDGSVSTAQLADALSLSVTPCWRRLRKLEDEGFITGFQANLDRRRMGFGLLGFVQIDFDIHTDHDAPAQFELAIRQCPEVLSCHKVTGQADYMLVVVSEDLDAYGVFVDTVLKMLPGVTGIHSTLSLKEVKASSRVPVRGV